ncbi:MAG TPA: HD domain-containing protein [Syntrophales bacterium]|jgi:HD-GYP domain-containing protein (c-di-GMP phosphodiesterase class II)|nr:HD domain-containing protein [Syntrophales bacterium]HRT62718.1 HD domain-containing protein [Syntrophales bacterium]
MLTEKQKLKILTGLGIELNRVRDLDILMERILTEARLFVNADAGSIYIRDGGHLHFSYTQNATLQKRLPAGAKLPYSTFVIPVNGESLAGHCAATGESLNVADVYRIGPSLPYRFAKRFDETSGYHTKSALVIPLKTIPAEVIGVLQVINARDAAGRIIPFAKKDERMMLHFASVAAVALQQARLTRDIILRMIRMAELRDPEETGAHVNRVAAYSVEIYERWASNRGLAANEIENGRDILRLAAMLHDVGKVGVSDLILKKPGRLTTEEYERMKEHVIVGARLFSDRTSEFDRAAAEVALNHHERWDGTGYPGPVDVLTGAGPRNPGASGKKGTEIPLFGRIVAIADVFDALSSRRSYKAPLEEQEVLETMKKGSGTHFDPGLIDVFFACLDSIRAIRMRYPERDIEPGVTGT